MMKRLLFFVLISLSVLHATAQFSSLNGPPANGGNNFALYVSGDLMFTATNGELFKSTNGGDSWDLVSLTDQSNPDPRLVLESDGVFIVCTNNHDRIYRSTDEGATWTGSNAGMPTMFGIPIPVITGGLTLSDGRFLVYGTNVVRVSNDAGLTWETIGVSDSPTYGMSEVNGAIWIGQGNYTAYTEDGGTTWTQVSNPHIGFGLSAVGFAEVDGKLFAATNASGGQGMKVSTDNGQSWSNSGNFMVSYYIRNFDGVLYAADFQSLQRSTDAGTTWETVYTYTPPAYGATLLLDNGQLWLNTGNGPTMLDPQSLETTTFTFNNSTNTILIQTDNYLLAGSGNSLFRLEGSLWIPLELPGSVISSETVLTNYWVNGDDVYFMYSNWGELPGVILSGDGGETWEVLDLSAIGENIGYFVSYNPMVCVTDVWYTSTLYHSQDGGATWQTATVTAADGANPVPDPYWAVRIEKIGSKLFALEESGVMISEDGGQSWVYHYTGIRFDRIVAWENRLVGYKTGAWTDDLYESTDGGTTWTETAAGIPASDFNVFHLVALDKYGDVLLGELTIPVDGVEQTSLYRLTQSGTWEPSTVAELPGRVLTLAGTSEANLYVSVAAQGVFWNGTNGVFGPVALPEQLSVWPNPSNGTLNFRLKTDVQTPYTVVDLTGRRVMQGQLLPGEQHTISTEQLPHGSYLLQLGANHVARFMR